jgi:hypothetical protein
MHKHELERLLSSAPRSVSEKMLQSVFFELCVAINTPKSLAAWILFREKEFEQLVKLEVSPMSYDNAQAFADDYLVSKFLSKYPGFKHPNLNPEQAASDSFHTFEKSCEAVNKRFSDLELDPSLWDPTLATIFRLARRKISSVLRRPDIQAVSDSFGWGPGATSVATGSHTSAYVKFAQRLDVTSNALVMGHCCVNSTPSWVNCQLQTDEFPSAYVSLTRDNFCVVRGNEIVFVPKNAKTHRIIAKEPHVNSYLQKGFGSVIRKLLRARAGVNLDDQTINQRMAKFGSESGLLSTIDLKGASDTVSQELVKFLLPVEWFKLLDQIRSKQGFLRKEKTWIYYHKFSSMGNACTFELESLIFWALCSACLDVRGQDTTLSVYGDDLIVPSDAYVDIVRVLNFAGFEVNSDKSFHSGPFRESCGKDYFLGTDVRPFFLKEKLSDVESLLKLANSIRRYSHSRNLGDGCDLRFRKLWLLIVSQLPKSIQDLKIPDGYGDGGLVSNFDEASPSLPRDRNGPNGWQGVLFKAIVRTPVKERMRDGHAGYTACLSASAGFNPTHSALKRDQHFPLGTGWDRRPVKDGWITRYDNERYERGLPSLGHHDLRNMTSPKIARIHTHGWYELGPWKNI